MKNSVASTLILSLSVLFAIGCTKVDSQKDLQQKLDEIKRQNNEALNRAQHATDFMYEGGQPGTLSLNGVLVIDAGKLDSRIKTSQSAGLNRSGKQSEVKLKSTLELNSLEDDSQILRKSALKDLEQKRTYINLGCELTESDVAGLKDITSELELKNLRLISASRLFICGKQTWNNQMILTLWASEIMLKDTDINYKKGRGNLSINANTLVLYGSNTVATSSEDSLSLVSPAADMQVFIGNEIYGDGQLYLESRGGNCVPKN